MYLFELWFSPDICLGVGWLGHTETIFSIFEERPFYSLWWLHHGGYTNSVAFGERDSDRLETLSCGPVWVEKERFHSLDVGSLCNS